MSHRTGRGRIRSPEELRRDLTLPVFYILISQAQASFPHSSTSGPSQYVAVVQVGNGIDPNHDVRFPVFVNWRQWNEIIVPILQDSRWRNWLGSLGMDTCQTDDGYPCAIPRQQVGPGVFSCNESLLGEYLDLLGTEILTRARAA
jgi:hypothetical protein